LNFNPFCSVGKHISGKCTKLFKIRQVAGCHFSKEYHIHEVYQLIEKLGSSLSSKTLADRKLLVIRCIEIINSL
jgi:hypothetical protein